MAVDGTSEFSVLFDDQDAEDFRSAIRDTMQMGLPQDRGLRPTFHFPATITYPAGTILDSEGRPIDPRIKGAPNQKDAKQPPCTVDYAPDTTNEGGLVGTNWDGRAVVTILDVDYELVADAIEVDLSAKRYLIQERTTVGLGSCTVYQLRCFQKGVETS